MAFANRVRSVAIGTVLLIIFAACQAAVSTSEPGIPETMSYSLQGVWTAEVGCLDGGISTNTLTITKSRWILERFCRNVADQSLGYLETDSGTWTSDGDTVTRIRIRAGADDTAEKVIVWGEDGNSFTTHPFHLRETTRPEDTRTYIRRTEGLVSSVSGEWGAHWSNQELSFRYEVSLSDTGVFQIVDTEYNDSEFIEPNVIWRAVGNWRIDEEELFIELSEVKITHEYPIGAEPWTYPEVTNGRLAYAYGYYDSHVGDTLLFSIMWDRTEISPSGWNVRAISEDDGNNYWIYLYRTDQESDAPPPPPPS